MLSYRLISPEDHRNVVVDPEEFELADETVDDLDGRLIVVRRNECLEARLEALRDKVSTSRITLDSCTSVVREFWSGRSRIVEFF